MVRHSCDICGSIIPVQDDLPSKQITLKITSGCEPFDGSSRVYDICRNCAAKIESAIAMQAMKVKDNTKYEERSDTSTDEYSVPFLP